ncbi:MAG TPA: response regulator transcription factor [Candidatus Saccharimonadales bacterium]|jgi:two-component system KDP operon response regulator KdpE|nr:response regulator transcription factor [Candidatus Saccharimonadales bacterium]
MSEGRILAVDDESQIRRVVRTTLTSNGYEVTEAVNGEDALRLVRSSEFDLVLLDMNMPEKSGLETCREIRAFGSNPAIIMVTVRDSETDKVEALDAGADGYVTKPFGISELLARIRSVLRRTVESPNLPAAHLKLGAADIDFEGRYVLTGSERVRLTPKELDLLSYMATHPNRTITHRELLKAVWGSEHGHDQQYLHVFVNRLRNKLEISPKSPKFLITEPWVGYRLQLDE